MSSTRAALLACGGDLAVKTSERASPIHAETYPVGVGGDAESGVFFFARRCKKMIVPKMTTTQTTETTRL